MMVVELNQNIFFKQKFNETSPSPIINIPPDIFIYILQYILTK